MKTLKKLSLYRVLLFTFLAVTLQPVFSLSFAQQVGTILKTSNSPSTLVDTVKWKGGENRILSVNKPVTTTKRDHLDYRTEALVDGECPPLETSKNFQYGYYFSKWYTHETNPSFTVDLGKICMVSKFVTHDCRLVETKDGYRNVDNYTIYVSVEDPALNQWKMVVDKSNQQNYSLKSDSITPVLGRYIRFVSRYIIQTRLRSDLDAVRIYEFEVWGRDILLENTELSDDPDIVALTANAGKENVRILSNDMPVMLKDSSDTSGAVLVKNNRFFPEDETWKGTVTNPYFIVDLQDQYAISRFTQFGVSGTKAIPYAIYVSEQHPDENNWKIVVMNEMATYFTGGITNVISPVKGRYVKYVGDLDKSSTVVLTGFEVWGEDLSKQKGTSFWDKISFSINWLWVGIGVVGLAFVALIVFLLFFRSGFKF